MSQITLNYRNGPLSAGAAGQVHGGDRLPWVPINGKDNFGPLAARTWQVHVYGVASAELAGWGARHDVALHVFDWRSEYETAGLARAALYLLRPDVNERYSHLDGSEVLGARIQGACGATWEITKAKEVRGRP